LARSSIGVVLAIGFGVWIFFKVWSSKKIRHAYSLYVRMIGNWYKYRMTNFVDSYTNIEYRLKQIEALF